MNSRTTMHGNGQTIVATYKGRTYEIPDICIMGFCTGAAARGEPSSILDAVAWWAYQTNLRETSEDLAEMEEAE